MEDCDRGTEYDGEGVYEEDDTQHVLHAGRVSRRLLYATTRGSSIVDQTHDATTVLMISDFDNRNRWEENQRSRRDSQPRRDEWDERRDYDHNRHITSTTATTNDLRSLMEERLSRRNIDRYDSHSNESDYDCFSDDWSDSETDYIETGEK